MSEMEKQNLTVINKDFLLSLIQELEDETKSYVWGIETKDPNLMEYGKDVLEKREKILGFENFFDDLEVPFPNLDCYPRPFYHSSCTYGKIEEYLFQNEIVYVQWNSYYTY